MSGGCGSGSRVNNDTMRRISEQQRAQQMPDELDDLDEMPDHELDEMPADELDEMHEENDKDAYDIETAQESNVIDNAPLDDWSSMAPGTVQITTLYDISTHDCMQNPHAELARTIVKDTFFGGVDTRSLDECLHQLQDYSCFRILKLEGIKNLPAHQMQEAYKSAYGIGDDEVRTTYHGSDKVNFISDEGFRGAASERAKFGKGIYTGTNVWEAVSYCPPDPRNVVQVLMVKNLVGLHAVGSQDQKDFGTHPNGRAYSTLTNPQETIMCSKHESQLCPTGIITLQYRMHVQPTLQHQAFVQFYHHRLVQRINDTWARPNEAPGAGAVVAAGAAPANAYVDHVHPHHAVGQEVYIEPSLTSTKQYKKYEKFVDWRGTIMRIMARDGKDLILFVQPTHDQDDKPAPPTTDFEIVQLNGGAFRFLKGLERHILNCLPCKLGHLWIRNAASDVRAELKRKRRWADDKNDDADEAGAKKARPADGEAP